MSGFILLEKFEVAIENIYIILRQFPKHEKHAFAADIKQTAWNLYRLIVEYVRKYHKKTTLNRMDVELDVLKAQIRMAHKRFKYIPFDKYQRISEKLVEVGRMIGGLHKSVG